MFDIKTGDSIIVLCDKSRGIALLKADVIEDLSSKIFPSGENKDVCDRSRKINKEV